MMSKMSRRVLTLLVAATIAALSLGFGGGAFAQGKIKIRSAYLPGVTWAPAWVAKDEGYFAKHGLDVSFTEVQHISAMPSIVGKQLDIAPATVVDLIKAAAGGVDVVAVAGGHFDTAKDAPNAIMVTKKSGITSVKDLAGKTIATPGQASILNVALLYWLKQDHVNPDSVRTVQVAFPNMPDQLAAGRVDAVEAIQPFVDRMQASGDISLGDQLLKVANPVISTVWIANRNWAKTHKVAIAKWTEALRDAEGFIKKHPHKARAIVAKYTKLPKKVVKSLQFPDFNLVVRPSDLTVWIKVLDGLGQLQRKVDATSLIMAAH